MLFSYSHEYSWDTCEITLNLMVANATDQSLVRQLLTVARRILQTLPFKEILKYWYISFVFRWWSGGKCDAFKETSTSNTKELDMANVAGVFIVLAVGIVLACLACLAEVICIKYRKCKEKVNLEWIMNLFHNYRCFISKWIFLKNVWWVVLKILLSQGKSWRYQSEMIIFWSQNINLQITI